MCILGINRVIVTARPVVIARDPENGHPGDGDEGGAGNTSMGTMPITVYRVNVLPDLLSISRSVGRSVLSIVPAPGSY